MLKGTVGHRDSLTVQDLYQGNSHGVAVGSEDYFHLYLISVQVKIGLTTTLYSSSPLEVVSGSVTTESDSSEDVTSLVVTFFSTTSVRLLK